MGEHTQINPPRGHTWGTPGTAVSSGDYGDSVYKEGLTAFFDNMPKSTMVKRDQSRNAMILLRNVTGGTLSGGDAVSFATGYPNMRAGSKVYLPPTASAFNDIDAIVDEWYGSGAVPNGHLFWAIIKGQVLAYTSYLAGAENLIPVGTRLVAGTASGSTATYAGKLGAADLTGATQLLANMMRKRIQALSAKTTANTNASILVEVDLGTAS
jgi:hypothetical protein